MVPLYNWAVCTVRKYTNIFETDATLQENTEEKGYGIPFGSKVEKTTRMHCAALDW